MLTGSICQRLYEAASLGLAILLSYELLTIKALDRVEWASITKEAKAKLKGP
jgi:hypothetical protein